MAATISVVAAGCWGSGGGHAASVRLTPGNHTLRLGDRVDVGDKVICMSTDGEVSGGAPVPEPGRGVGTGAGFGVSTTASGDVLVECPLGPPPARSSHLVVYQTFAGSSMYVEGSMSYVRVSFQAGGGIHSHLFADPSKPLISQAVAPGSYTVESWQRPCDGNCGTLDPATDRCTTTVTVTPGRSTFLVVVVTPGNGCTIEPRANG